jgi:hypothetical protein
MDDSTRAANVDALAQALLWTMVVPWIPCFVFYTLMHWTYKKDKAEYRAELSRMIDAKVCQETILAAHSIRIMSCAAVVFIVRSFGWRISKCVQ